MNLNAQLHLLLTLIQLKVIFVFADPGETPSQSSEVADSQHELDKDGKKKRQRRQRTHFTSQQLQVRWEKAGAAGKEMWQAVFDKYSSLDVLWRCAGAGGSVHAETLPGHVNERGDQHVDQPDRAKSPGEWILHQSKRWPKGGPQQLANHWLNQRPILSKGT